MELGGMACDLIVRLCNGSPVEYMLVAVSTSTAHRTVYVAVPLISKLKEAIFAGLLKALLVAEYVWGMDPV